MIDENDLINSAMMRLWEQENEGLELDEKAAKRIVRFTMLETLKKSSVLRSPRSVTINQALQAYKQISTIGAHEEPKYDPIDDWVEEEPTRQVWLIVDSFPEDDRLLLSLIWEHGCSMQDAADTLYKSKSFVFKRYQELLKKIKGQILRQQKAIR